MKNATLEAALRYATREKWFIFPVRFIGKKKLSWSSAEKSPSGNPWGYTRDEKEIREYWRRWPDAAIGLPTGAVNGIFVLDLDTEEGGHAGNGEASLAALMQGTPRRLPLTRGATTPTGGLHIYYKQPSGVAVPCSTSKLGPGIDVKGDGGFVVAPPSIRARVGRYEWQTTIGTATVRAAPSWVLDMVILRRPPKPPLPRVIDPSTLDPALLAAMSADAGKGVSLRSEDNAPVEDTRLKIEAALAYLPSDDYQTWFKVGCAIYTEYGEDGAKLFHEWSSESAKYNLDECTAKYEECPKRIDRKGPVAPNAVYALADQHDRSWRDWYRKLVMTGVQS